MRDKKFEAFKLLSVTIKLKNGFKLKINKI